MSLHVGYSQRQDRIWIDVQVQNAVRWWLTRTLTLKLIEGLIGRLDQTPLPVPQALKSVGDVSRPPTRQLDAEHQLSLEDDAPQPTRQEKMEPHTSNMRLVRTLQLDVKALESKVSITDGEQVSTLSMTRKETHVFLFSIVSLCKRNGWLDSPAFPAWLTKQVQSDI